MRLNEVFRSIQGEGIHTGVSTIFVRMQGCNLVCSWCDTKYALDPEGGAGVCYRDIIREVTQAGPSSDVVCFTGGEPMLHQGQLTRAARLLKGRGYTIHVETNGTIQPTRGFQPHVDFWSISPKLTFNLEKNYRGTKRSYRRVIGNYLGLDKPRQMKFVVSTEQDTKDIYDLIISYGIEKLPPIVIQPERFTATSVRGDSFGADRDLYLEFLPTLISWCQKNLKELPWRVLTQLHYLIWQGRKGI